MIDIMSQHGYWGLFILLALGVLGAPVPDELLMLFGGYLTSIATLNYGLTMFAGFLGSVTGMMISYTIGAKLGQPAIDKYGKWIGLTPKRFAKVRTWFGRYGNWTLLFAYFIPGLRHAMSYVSGISAMSFKKFVLIAVTGAFIWSLLFLSIGYYAGAWINFS